MARRPQKGESFNNDEMTLGTPKKDKKGKGRGDGGGKGDGKIKASRKIEPDLGRRSNVDEELPNKNPPAENPTTTVESADAPVAVTVTEAPEAPEATEAPKASEAPPSDRVRDPEAAGAAKATEALEVVEEPVREGGNMFEIPEDLAEDTGAGGSEMGRPVVIVKKDEDSKAFKEILRKAVDGEKGSEEASLDAARGPEAGEETVVDTAETSEAEDEVASDVAPEETPEERKNKYRDFSEQFWEDAEKRKMGAILRERMSIRIKEAGKKGVFTWNSQGLSVEMKKQYLGAFWIMAEQMGYDVGFFEHDEEGKIKATVNKKGEAPRVTEGDDEEAAGATEAPKAPEATEATSVPKEPEAAPLDAARGPEAGEKIQPLSLREIIELSKDTELKEKDFYLRSIREAGEVMERAGRTGLEKLREGVPTLFLSDIHARPKMLAAALAHKIPELDGKTVFDLLGEGKINLVLAGDLTHSEKERNWMPQGSRLVELWGEADAILDTELTKVGKNRMTIGSLKILPFKSSLLETNQEYKDKIEEKDKEAQREKAELMRTEMGRGLAVVKIVADLITRFPENFSVVRGNHDFLKKADFYKYADEGTETLNWTTENFGQDFVDAWDKMESNLSLAVYNQNVLVSHTKDKEGTNGDDIKNRKEETVQKLTWSKPRDYSDEEKIELAEADKKLKESLGITGAVSLVGHQPISSGNYTKLADGVFQINDPDRMLAAFVPAGEAFDPEKNIFALRPAELLPEEKKGEETEKATGASEAVKATEAPEAVVSEAVPASAEEATAGEEATEVTGGAEAAPVAPEAAPASVEATTGGEVTEPLDEARDPEAGEVPPSLPKKGLWAALKSKAGRVWREQFKGGVTEETEESLKSEKGKKVVLLLLDVLAKWRGVKAFYDVPRFITQFGFTWAEKREIMRAWRDRGEQEKEPVINKVEDRINKLKAKVENSKFLSPGQKQKIQDQISAISRQHSEETQEAERERDQAIANLIAENVKTRISKTDVLQQSINTLLMFTGAQAVRGGVYGLFSGFRRWQRVAEERALPEAERFRKEGQLHEVFVNGFKEWWSGLSGQKKDIWEKPLTPQQRRQNFLKSFGTTLLFVGFGTSAVSEIIGDHGNLSKPVGDLIDRAIEAWDKKSLAEIGNVEGVGFFDRVLFGRAGFREVKDFWLGKDAEAVDFGAAPNTGGAGGGDVVDFGPKPEAGGGATVNFGQPSAEQIMTPAEGGQPEEFWVSETKTGGEIEMTEELRKVIEHATVGRGREHDSIVVLAAKALAEREGLEVRNFREIPDWIKEKAEALARQDGVISGKGDLRLATAAIGKAIDVQDGHIVFIDPQTGAKIPFEEAREKFLYFHDAKTGADYPAGHEAGVAQTGAVRRAVLESEAPESELFKYHGAYKFGNAEAQQYLEETAEGNWKVVDSYVPDVLFSSEKADVLALAKEQGLELQRGGIDAPGTLNNISWHSVSLDQSKNPVSTDYVELECRGRELMATVHSSNGSVDEIGFTNGAINRYDRLVPEDSSEIVAFGRRLFRRANDTYQDFMEKIGRGDYLIKKAIPSELPPPIFDEAGSLSEGSMAGVLTEHGLRLAPDGTGLETLPNHKGDGLDWDKIFVGKNSEGIVKVNNVFLDKKGDSLYVRLFNSDGSVDLIRYIGSKIKSLDRLVYPSSGDLDDLIKAAKKD